jgi:hypothetical protein
MSRCPLAEKRFTPADPVTTGDAIKSEVREKMTKILADAVPETLFRIGLDPPSP